MARMRINAIMRIGITSRAESLFDAGKNEVDSGNRYHQLERFDHIKPYL
jgi:hypothetical protein